jgi:outer membrane protein assembly factor BamD (BamD/ComL family)
MLPSMGRHARISVPAPFVSQGAFMSVSGLAASSIFQFLSAASAQSKFQNFQKEFQQLGQDLSSGNLSQAQTDFQALQPSVQPVSSTNTQTAATPLSTAMSQLAQDLSSGNLSAAQQDFSSVQQGLSQASGRISGHHHHHHADSSGDSLQNPISQLFSQLGQALQSGNLSAAQTAYTPLSQEFQQLGASASSAGTASASTVNVSA